MSFSSFAYSVVGLYPFHKNLTASLEVKHDSVIVIRSSAAFCTVRKFNGDARGEKSLSIPSMDFPLGFNTQTIR